MKSAVQGGLAVYLFEHIQIADKQSSVWGCFFAVLFMRLICFRSVAAVLLLFYCFNIVPLFYDVGCKRAAPIRVEDVDPSSFSYNKLMNDKAQL